MRLFERLVVYNPQLHRNADFEWLKGLVAHISRVLWTRSLMFWRVSTEGMRRWEATGSAREGCTLFPWKMLFCILLARLCRLSELLANSFPLVRIILSNSC